MFRIIVVWLIFLTLLNSSYAEQTLPAITQPIPLSDLTNYQHYPPAVKTLINQAYILSKENLTYMYGSDEPKNGGMDCSGTIYYLLKKVNLNDAPRASSEMYLWATKMGHLHLVNATAFSSKDFDKLKPGDLLFWSGTYNANHNPPITHVMIYLGKNSKNKPLMFGSSDGRTYQGKKMWGVSVFDFTLPDGKTAAKFVGYSCVPHLTCEKVINSSLN